MKKIRIIQLTVLCFTMVVVSFQNLHAQDKKVTTVNVSGQVTDQDAKPVANAVVKAFHSKKVAYTNEKGEFTLDVASDRSDWIYIHLTGYESRVIEAMANGNLSKPVTLHKIHTVDGNSMVELPFQSMENKRSVASIFSISGEQLLAYPTTTFTEALSGLLPGVVVSTLGSMPGNEENSVAVYIRGEMATVYIDGVIRDPFDLSAEEVDKVEVLRDLSGRAALGIYGSGPVLWITTKKGKSFTREVKFSAEYGFSTPTVQPRYLNAYDYATLHNEALTNDGIQPYFNSNELEKYKNGSEPALYPNLDYIDLYVRPSAPFRKANVSFAGGDNNVNYLSMISYVGSEGLESIGEKYKSDRFRLRGNVNVVLNDYISMNVNLSGTYRTGRNSHSDLFSLISSMPANAHPNMYDGKYIISNDYPINIENNLVNGGYEQNSFLSTQNNVNLLFDLNDYVEGLTAAGSVSFDAASQLVEGLNETENLYRIVQTAGTIDSLELIQPKVIQDAMGTIRSNIQRKTVANAQLNYERTFGNHGVIANLAYYQGIFERNATQNYQPDKMQDITLRVNYANSEKYIAQIDLAYSGSMKMAKGKRFSLYPTIGLGWVASNEDFFKDVAAVNFLKMNASIGIIGNNHFDLEGYNSYYLYQTLWKQGISYRTGALGTFSTTNPAIAILQQGSDEYLLPKKQIMNIGIQGSFFDNSLAVDLNYYRNRDYDMISQLGFITPSVYGSGNFLAAGNYGEMVRYGLDGMLQYTKNFNDFEFTIGANALYSRGRYVKVDEPAATEEYRKLAGKNMDEYLVYHADGLFANQTEIDANTVRQVWGEVKPGDIRYIDYNNDNVVDEKDRYSSGEHSARLFYGLNLKVAYKGIGLLVTGQGIANGSTFINSNYIVATGSKQNYTEQMLDRWPFTYNLPRLTTTSQNNVQTSTFWLVNASAFRIKNVEFSYMLPSTVSHKIGAGSCKLFARGTNMFTVSERTKRGMELENPGAGISTYPVYKTMTFGLTCSF